MAGRKPINGVAMSNSERQRRHYHKEKGEAVAAVAAARAAGELPELAVAEPPVPIAKKPRRQRSDSAAAMIAAMVNAAKDYPEPPPEVIVRKDAVEYWYKIMPARALSDWHDTDLLAAAKLALTMADFFREDTMARNEGFVIVDYLGKVTRNPRFDVAEQLSKRIMALMRTLRIGGLASGKIGPIASARDVERSARAMHGQLADEDEDLLA